MRLWPGTLLFLPLAVHAQQAADIHAAHQAMLKHHGDSLNYLLLGERLEWRDAGNAESLDWEVQGWVGKDLDRLWVKTEGSRVAGAGGDTTGELQLLYSHAVAPYWDLQAGLRHDFGDGEQAHAVLGIQGLAPYWFETDLAVFFSERGKLSTRLELEYELLLTQRLILQPHLELDYHFSDDWQAGHGQGLGAMAFSLRLRYELRREVAPYIGFSWSQQHGATADLHRAGGHAVKENGVVLGLRLWY